MASPQIEDGFSMLANELLAAILVADLPKYQSVILAKMIMAVYGSRKSKRYFINHSQIARWLMVDTRIIRRALVALEQKRIILENDDGSHSFVKDWEKWLDEPSKGNGKSIDSPCLSDGERNFINKCKSEFSPQENTTHKQKRGTKQYPTPLTNQQSWGTNESPESTLKGTNESPESTLKGTNESPNTSYASEESTTQVDDQHETCVKPLTRGRARPSEELILRIDKDTSFQEEAVPERTDPIPLNPQAQPPPELIANSRYESDMIAFNESLKYASGLLPGKHEPDQAEIDRAIAFVQSQFVNQGDQLAKGLLARSRQYPSGWWIKAFKKARLFEIDGKGKVGSINFVLTTMDEWSSIGSSPPGRWDQYGDDMGLLSDPIKAAPPLAPTIYAVVSEEERAFWARQSVRKVR